MAKCLVPETVRGGCAAAILLRQGERHRGQAIADRQHLLACGRRERRELVAQSGGADVEVTALEPQAAEPVHGCRAQGKIDSTISSRARRISLSSVSER